MTPFQRFWDIVSNLAFGLLLLVVFSRFDGFEGAVVAALAMFYMRLNIATSDTNYLMLRFELSLANEMSEVRMAVAGADADEEAEAKKRTDEALGAIDKRRSVNRYFAIVYMVMAILKLVSCL